MASTKTMRVRTEFSDSSLDVSLIFLASLQFRLNHFDIMLDLREGHKQTIVRLRA